MRPDPVPADPVSTAVFVASRARRSGFTLIELLVVIAIIGVLVAMLLPAVQQAREAARRTACTANLANIALGLHNYHQSHGTFPPGSVNDQGPVVNLPKQGYLMGWAVQVLPYLEEPNLYAAVDFREDVDSDANKILSEPDVRPKWLRCPSSPDAGDIGSHYAGSAHDVEAPIAEDNSGVFFLNSRVRIRDIEDGLPHTLLLGEITSSKMLTWASGTRASLRTTGELLNDPRSATAYLDIVRQDDGSLSRQDGNANLPFPKGEMPGNETLSEADLLRVGGYLSFHSGGSNFAFGDGHVRFVGREMDHGVLQLWANRHDGQPVPAFD